MCNCRQLRQSITIDQYSSDQTVKLLQEIQAQQQGGPGGKLRSNRQDRGDQKPQVALPDMSTQYVSLCITSVSINKNTENMHIEFMFTVKVNFIPLIWKLLYNHFKALLAMTN